MVSAADGLGLIECKEGGKDILEHGVTPFIEVLRQIGSAHQDVPVS